MHERISCKSFLLGALIWVVTLQSYPHFILSRQHIFVATRSLGAFKLASVFTTQTAVTPVVVSFSKHVCVCVCA